MEPLTLAAGSKLGKCGVNLLIKLESLVVARRPDVAIAFADENALQRSLRQNDGVTGSLPMKPVCCGSRGTWETWKMGLLGPSDVRPNGSGSTYS